MSETIAYFVIQLEYDGDDSKKLVPFAVLWKEHVLDSQVQMKGMMHVIMYMIVLSNFMCFVYHLVSKRTFSGLSCYLLANTMYWKVYVYCSYFLYVKMVRLWFGVTYMCSSVLLTPMLYNICVLVEHCNFENSRVHYPSKLKLRNTKLMLFIRSVPYTFSY